MTLKENSFAAAPLIYLITRGEMTDRNFAEKQTEILDLIEAAVESNVPLVQIREKKLSARLIFELASKAAQITDGTNTKILVNDRADIALAANADGVHLTTTSLSAKVIRQNFPPDFIIGVSAHTVEEAEFAKRDGANFAAFSPIFFSPEKGAPQKIEKLREVCDRLKPFPIIALGGIDATNFMETLAAGASGFAAIRFLNDSVERKNGEIEKLLAKIENGL